MTTLIIEHIDPALLEEQRVELHSILNKLHNRANTSTPIRVTIYEAEALEGVVNMLNAWSDNIKNDRP